MKHFKTLGLAAVAAAALIAIGGASTASATTLCTTTSTPCATDWEISSTEDSHITLQITSLRMFTTGNTNDDLATCSGTLTATMENTGSQTETAKAGVNTLDFSCGVNTAHPVKLGTLEIHRISGTHNGTVTLLNTEWTTVIFEKVHCTYGVTGASALDLGVLEKSTITVNTVINKTSGGFLCPSTAGWEWSGHLEAGLTTPSVIYVEP